MNTFKNKVYNQPNNPTVSWKGHVLAGFLLKGHNYAYWLPVKGHICAGFQLKGHMLAGFRLKGHMLAGFLSKDHKDR